MTKEAFLIKTTDRDLLKRNLKRAIRAFGSANWENLQFITPVSTIYAIEDEEGAKNQCRRYNKEKSHIIAYYEPIKIYDK